MRVAAPGKALLQLLLSLAVIIALTAVPAGITVSTSAGLPVASAQPPPPGEPGGNHSTPGDNKKKHDNDRRNTNNPSRRGSDQSDSRRQGDSRQGSQRPTSTVGAQQNRGSQQMPRQQTPRQSPKDPHAIYEGRSRDGTYRAGNSGFDGYAEEQASWDAREKRTGIPIERRKIRVKITDPTNPNGPPIQREYDGLEPIPGQPGKYTGLEHKVGKSPLRPNQRLADGLIRSGIPGRGVLRGKPIEVVAVPDPIRVPTPVPPATAPAPAPAAPPPAVAPPAPAAPPVVAPPAAPAPPPAIAPPAPAAHPVVIPTAPLVPITPAPVVAPVDTGIAWGAMFHDYAHSFYGPFVTIAGGLAAIGGLLSYPLAGRGLAGGG